jgi:hypothetical protein
MQAIVTDRPVEQVVAAIGALDLEPIKFKLMDPEEGEGWSRPHVDQMELAYKRFLTLFVTHPEETLAPSKDVDKFWHGHILDTLKYAEDCEKVFGYFLHHFPYFGMRGAEDAANQARAAEATRRLYSQEFGGSESAAYCGAIRAENAAYCGAVKRDEPAYCGAIRAEKAAYCGAIRAESAAYCGAVKRDEAAYCGAIKAAKPAYCGAIRGETPAWGQTGHASDELNVSVRPGL